MITPLRASASSKLILVVLVHARLLGRQAYSRWNLDATERRESNERVK